jgi:hypothetical protein
MRQTPVDTPSRPLFLAAKPRPAAEDDDSDDPSNEDAQAVARGTAPKPAPSLNAKRVSQATPAKKISDILNEIADDDDEDDDEMSAEEAWRMVAEALPPAAEDLPPVAAPLAGGGESAQNTPGTLRLGVKHTPNTPPALALRVSAESSAASRASDVSHWTPADLAKAASTAQPASKLGKGGKKHVRFAADLEDTASKEPPLPASNRTPHPSPFGAEVRERMPAMPPTVEMLEAHMDRRIVSVHNPWKGPSSFGFVLCGHTRHCTCFQLNAT